MKRLRLLFEFHLIQAISFALMVSMGALSAAGQNPTYSQPQELQPSQMIDRELTAAETHRYKFSLLAGEFFQVRVEQKGVDITLKLTDASGNVLGTMNSPNGKQGPETLSFVEILTENVLLEVSGSDPKAGKGIYTIRRESPRSITLQDWRRAEIEQLYMEGLKARAEKGQAKLAIGKLEEAEGGWRELGEDYLAQLTSEQIKQANEAPREHDVQALPVGRVQERQLRGGEIHNYLVELMPGQVLRIEVRENGIDCGILVGSIADTETTTQRNLGGGYGRETLTFVANQAGTHVVLIGSTQSLASGSYELTAVIKDAATAEDQERIEAERLTMEGLAGRKKTSELGSREAIARWEQALPLWTRLGERYWQGWVSNSLGEIYDELGERQKALDYIFLASRLSQALGDSSGEASALNNLGLVYLALGEKQKALEQFSLALPLVRAVGNRDREATTLNNIGGVYHETGEQRKALEYYHLALPLLRAARNRRGEGVTLNNMGSARESMGELPKALELYELTLPLRRALGDRGDEAATLNNIGGVYDALGQKQKALEFFNLALPLLAAVGDKPHEAVTLANLRVIWNELGRRPLAIYYGKRAVNKYQELRQAIRLLDQETQRTYLKTVESTYRELAEILISTGRLEEAHQVLNAFKDQQYFDFNPQTVKRPLPLALTQRESVMASLNDAASDKVGNAGNLIAELKHTIVNRSPNAKEATRLRQLESNLKGATDDLLSIVSRTKIDFDEAPDPLKDKAPNVPDTRELHAVLSQVRARTEANTVAVYTVVGAKQFSALIVTENDIRAVFSPIKGKQLNQKAEEFWGLLQQTNYDPKVLAQELYSDIFKPIEAKLPKDTKTILWSLDGKLSYIPMAALHDGKEYLVARYKQVVFTRADSERLTRDVSSKWTGLGLGSSRPHDVRMLGGIVRFASLPGVTAEMQTIFKQNDSKVGIFDGDVLQDEKFTRDSMMTALKQQRRLVHISSHFSFTPGDESLSFLLLGDGTTMTLSEMKKQTNLFAGVELLTLSACNTAAQKEGSNGREVDGFAELAQRLGAGAVMASLWQVADNSTPLLMRRFYEARQRQTMNKAEALRHAQLALLTGTVGATPLPEAQKGTDWQAVRIIVIPRDGKHSDDKTRSSERIVEVDSRYAQSFKLDPRARFAHPYYWSPFILFGNWK